MEIPSIRFEKTFRQLDLASLSFNGPIVLIYGRLFGFQFVYLTRMIMILTLYGVSSPTAGEMLEIEFGFQKRRLLATSLCTLN
jgi:hypothetical protein